MRNGNDAAEALVHELVHLYLWFGSGATIPSDSHGYDFMYAMRRMGITVQESDGFHIDYCDSNMWWNWLHTNEDLELAQFKLPGWKD